MHSIAGLYHKEIKKNTIIIILAALGVVFGLYAFAQKVKADQNAEEAIKQHQIAEQQRAIVEEIKALAITAQIEAEKQRDMAVRLQQQLDKCK